jgi:hypothetical protein
VALPEILHSGKAVVTSLMVAIGPPVDEMRMRRSSGSSFTYSILQTGHHVPSNVSGRLKNSIA